MASSSSFVLPASHVPAVPTAAQAAVLAVAQAAVLAVTQAAVRTAVRTAVWAAALIVPQLAVPLPVIQLGAVQPVEKTTVLQAVHLQ